MGHEVKVKAKFKGTTRRFEIHSGISWDELSSKLSNLFNLEPDFRLKYRDDENELVLISSQEELDEALKVNQKKSGLLYLLIEDPSAPQATDTTLLSLENRNQDPNQGKKKGMDSCYAAAASSIAPEFAAMNARLESKRNEEANQPNKPAVSHDDQKRPQSGASSVSKHEELVHSKYVDFSEVMGRSNQQDQSSQQDANKNEKGTSRGWFDNFEDQRQHQPPNHTKSQSKKNKSKKKRGFYSEFASTIAPQLASIKVRKPQERTSLAVASEADDTDITDISEPPSLTVEAASLSMPSPPSEIAGENLNNAADFNQQMVQNGQQRVIKRPKRSKKHGKKKSCYAQAALDIGPLYQAMNDRLKERQLQHQNSQDLNGDSEEEMPEEDSPEYEPFVFVDSADGESMSPTPTETGQTGVVIDGPFEQPPEQQQQPMDSEPSVGDREMNENVTQDPTDIKVPHGSMELIVEQTVQRIQQLNLNQSRQAPSVDASTITEVYGTSKVVHKGITCDNCKDEIQGVRYKCGNCRDFDLCEPCESKDLHDMNHVFVKLRFPAPGIGRRHGEMAPIFKNSVYKSTHDKKLRKAEKEEKKAAYKQLKHALKAQEKERKREEKYLRKQKQMVKSEQQPPRQQEPTDPRAQKMAKVYEKLKMEYICDVSFPDGSVVSPGQKLECIEGGIMVTPEKVQGLVPHLEQGEQGQVSVEFIAPELPGTYSSKWHLTYGLHTFGPQLWCEIVVAAPSNAVKEKPVLRDQTTLVNSAFINTPLVEDAKLQAAAYHIGDDSGSEYLSSEETQQGRERIPISDVPLNSIEAPQRQDLEWDAGCVHDVEAVDVSADNDESVNLMTFSGTEDFANNNSEDSDDEEDSDSSLDEFTVLIPPCFDPEAPLSADPTPVKVECPKRSGSFSSKYLPRSFEPYLNLDDNEPSSLPTMTGSERVASFENLARSTDKPTLVQSAPVLTTDQGEETPSGRISPVELSGQRSTQTQTLASIQSHITPGETVPLVSHSDPIARVSPHSCDRRTSKDESPLPTNVVSDVLSSAIDVVTNAGKAAIATVDNFINGGVQASAVYKPEDDCEVTVDGRSDSPPRTVSRVAEDNPMSRLIEMGFADRRLNGQLLRKHNNNLRATIDELLSQTGNDWSSQRH